MDIKKIRCQAKVIGTLITVAGAMLMTLYKGHVVNLIWSQQIHPPRTNAATTDLTNKDWLKDSILLILITLTWAVFFILQVCNILIFFFHGDHEKYLLAVTFLLSMKVKIIFLIW